METSPCDDDRKNTLLCPVYAKQGHCYSDTHHTEYPKNRYQTRLERNHRELEANKVFVCRALHNAIHASGYTPDMPSRADMAEEVWLEDPTERSQEEMDYQLWLGKQTLNGLTPKDAA